MINDKYIFCNVFATKIKEQINEINNISNSFTNIIKYNIIRK